MNESNQIGIPSPAQTMGGNPSSLVEFDPKVKSLYLSKSLCYGSSLYFVDQSCVMCPPTMHNAYTLDEKLKIS
jgi:hypothetical protein